MTVSKVKEIYIQQDKSIVETAKELKVSFTVLRMFLIRNGISKHPESALKERARYNAKINIWNTTEIESDYRL